MAERAITTDLQFSLAERWLLHAVMLDRLGYGPSDGDVTPAVGDLAILEKLEHPQPQFSERELKHLRRACLDWTDRAETHARDRSLAIDIVESINRILHSAAGDRR